MTERIEEISGEEIHLLCDVCHGTAMKFEIGEFWSEKGLVITKLTGTVALPLEQVDDVFAFLRDGRIGELHEWVKENTNLNDGLEAYCPECDKVYCIDHYSTDLGMDGGYYDCTYGTCPEGHRRIIDD